MVLSCGPYIAPEGEQKKTVKLITTIIKKNSIKLDILLDILWQYWPNALTNRLNDSYFIECSRVTIEHKL